MSVSQNPDKYIRKAVFDLVNDLVVISMFPVTIKCFDSRLASNTNLNEYVLLTSQTKEIIKANKCEYRWDTSLLIEIYTKRPSVGNPGSRLLLNDIENAVYNLLQPSLNIGGYITLTQNISFETQLETVTSTENIFRSFLRLNLTLI